MIKTPRTANRAAHTPGPWYPVRTGDDGASEIWSKDSAERWLWHIGDTKPKARAGEAAANARLIATAPELLALVSAVLSDDTDGGPEAAACYCDKIGYGCWHCAARLTIAKIEGRAWRTPEEYGQIFFTEGAP